MGILSSTTSFVDGIGGVDLWVVDPRVQNVDDIKSLTDTQVNRVNSVPGVARAVPLYKGSIKARLPDGTSQNSQLIGLDDATLIGGPASMLSGRLADLRNADAVLIDEDAARGKLAQPGPDGRQHPAGLGTTFELNDHRATVVGVYRGQRNFQSQPMVYTTYNRAKTMLPNERKLLSYILVRLQPGADVRAVQALVRQSTGLRAYNRRGIFRQFAGLVHPQHRRAHECRPLRGHGLPDRRRHCGHDVLQLHAGQPAVFRRAPRHGQPATPRWWPWSRCRQPGSP